MSENTPKLDLLMKDPVLDGHEYFNVKTMMNDNWEKIDAFAEAVDGEVKELQQRLDIEQRKEITLQPGLQIVESDKTVPFQLTGLKGRTLVNLLGRRGSMDSLTGWFTTSGTSAVIDTTLKSQGTGSAKVTITGTNGTLYMPLNGIVDFTKHHLIVADLRKGDSTHVSMSFWNGTGNYGLKTVTASSFTPAFILIPPNQFNVSDTNNLQISVNGTTGQYSYADAVRVYAISADEYVALGNMSAEQIAAKYPYVDSVKPVRNPYVIQYGENLLPPFYEWEVARSSVTRITEPYSASITSSVSDEGLYLRYFVPVVAGQTYTYSVDISGRGDSASAYAYACDSNRARLTGRLSGSITVPAGASILEVVVNTLVSSGPVTGTFYFNNPMLNIGREALPFVPREDSMLALQTDLYADPLTGANADSVFERDGQYFKNKRWQRLLLDGSLVWSVHDKYTGYRSVTTALTGASGTIRATKYDGKILGIMDPLGAGGGDFSYLSAGMFYVTISNADSGWGDNYTNLTADEIKAYFMGWKMYDTSTSSDGMSIYNRTDNLNKGWVYRAADNSAWAGGTTTLPTTQSPAWSTPNTRFGPYELVYQLATPTVEPVVSEGQLTLNEGSNQIEVGTGIVLREKADITWNGTNAYSINAAIGTKYLSNKVLSYLGVYKNSTETLAWTQIVRTSINGSTVDIKATDYDPSAAYNVTYLMLDTLPVAAFCGSIPGNEKSLLADIVQDVQEATARLSVVENKKAEKDSPSWITPTLLNSWVNYDGARRPLSFYKDSMGRVHVEGYIKGGIGAFGTVIFHLPEGYRPGKYLEVSAPSYNAINSTPYPSTLFIGSTSVTCDNHVNNGYLVVNFSFLAEK